jgi:hypothetical protein
MSILWHYTTQTAVVNILRHKQLFASNVQYMNDHMELRYAMELVPMALASIPDFAPFTENPEAGTRNAIAQRLLTHSAFSEGTYALSLSDRKDDLSQWRAYSGDATGYALGFDKERLMETIPSSGWPVTLGKCIYEEEEQLRLLRGAMSSLLGTSAWERYLRAGNKLVPGFAYAFQGYFMEVAPWIKHPAFEREQEWRLVSLPELGSMREPAQFGIRDGRSFLVPYMALQLKELESCGLTEVMIGPNANPVTARMATQLLLRDCDIPTSVDVTSSKVPYRRL